MWSRHPTTPRLPIISRHYYRAPLKVPRELCGCACSGVCACASVPSVLSALRTHLVLLTLAYRHALAHTYIYTSTRHGIHTRTHLRTSTHTYRHMYVRTHRHDIHTHNCTRTRAHIHAQREREGEGGYSCKSAKNVAGRDYTGSGR